MKERKCLKCKGKGKTMGMGMLIVKCKVCKGKGVENYEEPEIKVEKNARKERITKPVNVDMFTDSILGDKNE